MKSHGIPWDPMNSTTVEIFIFFKAKGRENSTTVEILIFFLAVLPLYNSRDFLYLQV